MKIVTKTPSTKTQLMLESLRKTATQTLERKRRLGHYAVLWQDGKVVLQGEDAPVMVK
ncbi:hypothetical protein [Thiothrix subterranea]|uniref:Uncharacterized protein n=1 Tax=Thiothrix subterranea TaxID=2735563 RepID=A0AA51R3K7_9GAMM|nr:hypothetical protein [Thiothrix subterranea]MDQ5770558.1 hypothetical protein [Thiothrix subterranea]WML85746.1 hypothetical protein RCG00_15745 [Thiothrix subterranea]